VAIAVCTGNDNANRFGLPDDMGEVCENDARARDRSRGRVQPQDIMIEKMWDELSDEQKRTRIARIIDSKILMKENMIKYLKFKIETFNMVDLRMW